MSQPPDLEELRTFCVAAELGTLGRAAQRLGVSQPGVSKRLAQLEARAGARLLDRTPHGVTLTPAGRDLFVEARRLLQQAESFTQALVNLRHRSAPIRLAVSHSAMEAIAADVLGERSPDADRPVEVVIADSSVVYDLLAERRSDLGVATPPARRRDQRGVSEVPLAEDAIVCAVPAGHPWAGRRSISIREFGATPMVMRDPRSSSRVVIGAVLADRGLPLPPALAEAATPQAALREARARNAPVLLSRAVLAGHDFQPLTISGLSFPRTYVLLLPATGEPAPPVRALMDDIQRRAQPRRATARPRVA